MIAHSDLSPLEDAALGKNRAMRVHHSVTLQPTCNAEQRYNRINLNEQWDVAHASFDALSANIRTPVVGGAQFSAGLPGHSANRRTSRGGANTSGSYGSPTRALGGARTSAPQATPLTLLLAHAGLVTAALMLVTALAIGWGMAAVVQDAPAYVRVQQ